MVGAGWSKRVASERTRRSGVVGGVPASLGRLAGDPAPPRPAEQPFPRFVLPAALVIFIFLLWAQRGVCFSFISMFSTCVCFIGLRVPVIDTWFFSGVRMGRGGSSQRVSPRFRRERCRLGLLPARELRPVWKVVLTPPRVPFVSAAAGFDDRTEGLGPKPPRSRILRCLRWVGEQSPAPNTRSQPR